MKHKLLKSLMKDNNCTYSDIAKITNYSEDYIKKIINNKIELSYKMSVIISIIFKLTPDDVFYTEYKKELKQFRKKHNKK